MNSIDPRTSGTPESKNKIFACVVDELVCELAITANPWGLACRCWVQTNCLQSELEEVAGIGGREEVGVSSIEISSFASDNVRSGERSMDLTKYLLVSLQDFGVTSCMVMLLAMVHGSSSGLTSGEGA